MRKENLSHLWRFGIFGGLNPVLTRWARVWRAAGARETRCVEKCCGWWAGMEVRPSVYGCGVEPPVEGMFLVGVSGARLQVLSTGMKVYLSLMVGPVIIRPWTW